MDELLEESGIDFLVQIRIGRRSISVLGEREGHMTMIDQDIFIIGIFTEKKIEHVIFVIPLF